MQKDTGRGSQPTAALQWHSSCAAREAVHSRATDYVFQPDPEISLRARAARDKHTDWASLRKSIIAGATVAARHGLPMDGAAHVKHLTSIREYNRFLAVKKLKPPLL